MTRRLQRSRGGKTLLAMLSCGALLATACGSSSGAESRASGQGVAPGSDAAAYAKALEDGDEITLEWGGHATGPANNPTAQGFLDYSDMVTEMSGGRVQFQMDWGGAKASLPEVARAMEQGRIDMGSYIPTYAPDEWPITDAFSKISSVEKSDAIAHRLAMIGARIEFSHTWEPLIAEHERHGMQIVYPIYSPNSAIQMVCTGSEAATTIDELRGKRIRTSSTSHNGMAQALGMTPVSLPSNELFNGLQRGVIDCAASGMGSQVSQGISSVTGSWVTAGEAGVNWIESPMSWGISQRAWDRKLPLAAQQLLWDTQGEFLEIQLEASYKTFLEAVVDAQERGFSFGEYDEEVSTMMADYLATQREETAAELESAGIVEDGTQLLADYSALYDKWYAIVTEELGYPEGINWPDLPAYVEQNGEIDFGPVAQRIYDEVLSDQRPS